MKSAKITVQCISCGKTFSKYQRKPNQTQHFCSRKCFHGFAPWNKGKKWSEEIRAKLCKPHITMAGSGNPSWKGGRSVETNGYITIWTPEGRMPEHRYVIEQHLGRKLRSDEIVHHKNMNRQDNRIENLEITNISSHLHNHNLGKGNWRTKTGRVNINCVYCGKNFTKKKSEKRKFCSQTCYFNSRLGDTTKND